MLDLPTLSSSQGFELQFPRFLWPGKACRVLSSTSSSRFSTSPSLFPNSFALPAINAPGVVFGSCCAATACASSSFAASCLNTLFASTRRLVSQEMNASNSTVVVSIDRPKRRLVDFILTTILSTVKDRLAFSWTEEQGEGTRYKYYYLACQKKCSPGRGEARRRGVDCGAGRSLGWSSIGIQVLGGGMTRTRPIDVQVLQGLSVPTLVELHILSVICNYEAGDGDM